MALFNRSVLFVFLLLCVLGCKSKKASLSGEDPVEVSDFIAFFPDRDLPYSFADTTLLKKDNDSLLISPTVFTQFVPDSILTRLFGKAKPKIYPMGRSSSDDTYLFAKVVSGNRRVALVLGFDKNTDFIAALPLLTVDNSAATQQTATIDKRSTLTKMVYRKNADGSTNEGKDVYVLNNESKSFMLIMTDPLDDKPTELINPIDTLSRKHKYTADYGTGKMNLVSIRDGKRDDRLNFFIHFEKNKGECTGELKGEAVMKTPTTAEYRTGGDPCVLQFKFTNNAVIVKELEGCGSRRGLRCSFDGTYSRKKEAKPKPSKEKGK
jgi:hypothetical protein